MDDLIRRQAAIDVLEERLWANGYSNVALASELNRSIGYLMQLPSAQPERINGRWIYHPEIGWGETWLCDQCGEKTSSTVMGKPRANFCPNCGADMRQEEKK